MDTQGNKKRPKSCDDCPNWIQHHRLKNTMWCSKWNSIAKIVWKKPNGAWCYE